MAVTQVRASNARVSRRVSQWVSQGPLAARVAVVYLAIRLVSWVLLHLAAAHQVWFPGVTGPSKDHIDLAVSWDATWYEQIADHGYPDQLPVGPDGRVQQNPWAFYPVFPYTVRLVMGLTGGSFATVAPLLALAAGLGAAILMAHLFRATIPSHATGPAIGAVAVWAAFPSAPVLQMAYTESFAMLLLVANLLFIVRRQWWAAGVCALLLGLTRPIALPLAIVILVSVVLRWREGRPARQEAGAIGFAVVATGLSGIVWTTIAWLGTGRRDAYPATMEAWRGDAAINVLDPWVRTIGYAWDAVRGRLYCGPPGTHCGYLFVIPALSIVIPLALSLLILIPRVAPGIDLRLRVWSAAYAVYLLAVVDGGTSIIRYLIPLFPLSLVLVGAHRQRGQRRGRGDSWISPRWELRTLFWVAAGIAGQIGWIWWLVLFTPPSDYPP